MNALVITQTGSFGCIPSALGSPEAVSRAARVASLKIAQHTKGAPGDSLSWPPLGSWPFATNGFTQIPITVPLHPRFWRLNQVPMMQDLGKASSQGSQDSVHLCEPPAEFWCQNLLLDWIRASHWCTGLPRNPFQQLPIRHPQCKVSSEELPPRLVYLLALVWCRFYTNSNVRSWIFKLRQ